MSRPAQNGDCLLSHLRSTIGVNGLNFSVRNGKRWNPVAIVTSMPYHIHVIQGKIKKKARNKKQTHETEDRTHDAAIPNEESFGPLVMLGFDVAVFTPASYLRHRL